MHYHFFLRCSGFQCLPLLVELHILKKRWRWNMTLRQMSTGELRDVPRAKKSRYVPMVLSRKEIDSILGQLPPPFDLVVKLLFGCGLRLFECLQMRVRDFNFEDGILTMHGRGKKDRTVPLPKTILQELKSQMKAVGKLHEQDLAAGYDGVFLDDAVGRKYPKAPQEFIHQWFFPMGNLTVMTDSRSRPATKILP